MAEENKTNQSVAATPDKGKVTYSVAGQDVTLSYDIVRRFLTKGNGSVTDTDLTQFISLCKYNQLNPFLGEAHLVKYGDTPAQMIVSALAFMKRADACTAYDGFDGGIVVARDGVMIDIEGSCLLPGDELVGGWCVVYRTDRSRPTKSKVGLQEYDKKQSSWKTMPATMISKVAKAQAHRDAFPSQLGAMYIQEEAVGFTSFEDVTEQEKAKNANKTTIGFGEPQKPLEATAVTDTKKEQSQQIETPF